MHPQDADGAKGKLPVTPKRGEICAVVRSCAVLIGVVGLLSVATMVGSRALRAGMTLRDDPVAECASRFDADKTMLNGAHFDWFQLRWRCNFIDGDVRWSRLL